MQESSYFMSSEVVYVSHLCQSLCSRNGTVTKFIDFSLLLNTETSTCVTVHVTAYLYPKEAGKGGRTDV